MSGLPAPRDHRGRWKKGCSSPNPAGRPRGSKNRQRRRAGDLERPRIGRDTIGGRSIGAHFTRSTASRAKSKRRRPASALPFGCCSIRRLSGPACAPNAPSRSTCQRALSMLPRYERMAHGSIGHACNGFSGAAGAQPKPIYGGSALQWARFNLAKYRVEGGVVPFTLGHEFLDARGTCTRSASACCCPVAGQSEAIATQARGRAAKPLKIDRSQLCAPSTGTARATELRAAELTFRPYGGDQECYRPKYFPQPGSSAG